MSTVMQSRAKRLRDEKGGTFRVLVGAHLGDGPPGCDCDACAASSGKNHVYSQGDLVESLQDLETRFNQGPFSRKFERVSDVSPGVLVFDPIRETLEEFSARASEEVAKRKGKAVAAAAASTAQAPAQPTVKPAKPTAEQLAKLPTNELAALAAAEEIDISKAKGRDEIIKAVRAGLGM